MRPSERLTLLTRLLYRSRIKIKKVTSIEIVGSPVLSNCLSERLRNCLYKEHAPVNRINGETIIRVQVMKVLCIISMESWINKKLESSRLSYSFVDRLPRMSLSSKVSNYGTGDADSVVSFTSSSLGYIEST